ncbi:FKBP-type peptidyl-prolyl cis-trans isomerase [Raoultibacter massiliensis]|uniref:Peptidyl-prolyl cis-trans isomerase n=1 Tax=Raoultibacter massiliensis TaxID=1852371 RepID=A0ABV1JD15_9ACTN
MRHSEYNGHVALVYYRGGALGEGAIEDHSPESQTAPECILLGSGEVPRGVSDVLYDMEIGEERTAVIPCEKAYGWHDPAGVQRYPRSFIPGGDRLEKGTVFSWRHPVSGKNVPVVCIEAAKDVVTIDFNHLLAGKDLEYWFKLVDVVDDAGVSICASKA